MRIALSTIIGLALLTGGTVAVAEEPSDPAGEATQRLSLPGFEVSIEVPAAWEVEPLIGGPYSQPPHPTSPFALRLWTGAAGREDQAGCFLHAYSRMSCSAPVDLETETSGIGPPWAAFDSGSSAFMAHESMGEWACVRHLSSDGVDLFEVKCCGGTVPEDGWSSIAETLQLPGQTRPSRIAATNRSLIKDASVASDLWGTAYGPTLAREDVGSRSTAHKRMWDTRVVAAVEELARPAKSVTVSDRVYRDDDGDEVLVVDAIRAPKADPNAVRDAMLAFARAEWAERRGAEPILQTVPLGHLRATRAVFFDGAAPEYIISSGRSAIKVRAQTDEVARSWLEGLPCHHLDAWSVMRDVLIEETRPDR